jgi:uncharacterized protein
MGSTYHEEADLRDSTPAAATAHENPYGLQPDPIPREWILEGNPTARRKLIVGSSDNMASTHMWDCTAGRFDWYYGSDEVIFVLEGSVVVEDAAGARRQLAAGDIFLFPAGSRFHWTVPRYIRKIAFLHAPLSRKMRLLKGIYDFFKSPFKRKQPATAWTG